MPGTPEVARGFSDGVVEEVAYDGHTAVTAEFGTQVIESVGAACGGDAAHAVDGLVGGSRGGVDVPEREMGLREAGQVDGVAAGVGGGVVCLVCLVGGVAEVAKR
jgi:hypothetical protein